jgi:hypothetical protein
MRSFSFGTAKDFKETYLGTHLLDIVNILDLRISIIEGSKLRKFKRKIRMPIVLGLRNSYEGS